MRPLTEDETKVVFEKLHKFIGKNIKALVQQGEQPYCLRLQKNRVFYVREDMMRRATNVSWLCGARALHWFSGACEPFGWSYRGRVQQRGCVSWHS